MGAGKGVVVEDGNFGLVGRRDFHASQQFQPNREIIGLDQPKIIILLQDS